VKIIWSPLAIERTTEIAKYIAQDNPSAAQNWIGNIFSRVEQLQTLPESGRTVPEICRKEIRELMYGNYRIIYRVDEKSIFILTVRHGRQILPNDEILS